MDDEGEITVGSVASIAYLAQESSCHSLQQQLNNTLDTQTSFSYILTPRAAIFACQTDPGEGYMFVLRTYSPLLGKAAGLEVAPCANRSLTRVEKTLLNLNLV